VQQKDVNRAEMVVTVNNGNTQRHLTELLAARQKRNSNS